MRIPGPTPAQCARFSSALDALQVRGPIILAVSGGADSLALLLLAASVRHDSVIAATVDHRLRKEAAEEARLVQSVCRSINVHHRTLAVKVEDDGSGIQASAREARYDALVWYALRKEAGLIATAHHVDDQAETVLMRIARGSGVSGLAGVRERRPLKDGVDVIRPLLGWQRSELAAIVSAARIEPVDDPSNRDPRYDRTRARALMAQGWPEAARLAAVSRHMRDADDAIEWSAEQLFASCFRQSGGVGELDTTGLPRELVRRLAIRSMAAMVPGSAVPRGDELGRLLDRLEAGHISTLGQLKITPGSPWRFESAPPHRS